MTQKQNTKQIHKSNLHPRNLHNSGYDFDKMIEANSELVPYVHENRYGNRTVDFFDPQAVFQLNKALLQSLYDIKFWDLPKNTLCPPIPGRVDYIHYLADLLIKSNGGKMPQMKKIHAMDVGVGASCIYPLLGHRSYGWSFLGSETDDTSIKAARKIVEENGFSSIELRQQSHKNKMFTGVLQEGELFDMTICNPPFFASQREANGATTRKVNNLRKEDSKKVVQNFKGRNNELWCKGGELQFLSNMIKESSYFSNQVFWFTALVSKKDNLAPLYYLLKQNGVEQVETIEMAQGNKISRFIAWTFLNKKQQKIWTQARWR